MMKTRWLLPFLIGSLAWAIPRGEIPLSQMTEVKTSVYNENDLQAVLLLSKEGSQYLGLRDSHGRFLPSTGFQVSYPVDSIRWLNSECLALLYSNSEQSAYTIYVLLKDGYERLDFIYLCRGSAPFPSRFLVRANQLEMSNDCFDIVIRTDNR